MTDGYVFFSFASTIVSLLHYLINMKLFLLLKTALLAGAIQLVHGRCVCDPADTTCLNDCGNTNEIESLYVILETCVLIHFW